jgi:hypothetical protein
MTKERAVDPYVSHTSHKMIVFRILMIFEIVQALSREQSFSLLSSPPRTFRYSFLRRIFPFIFFLLFSYSLHLCVLFVLFAVTRSVVPPDSFPCSSHHSTRFVRVVYQRCVPSVFWPSERHVSIVFTQVTCVELFVSLRYYVPSTSQFTYVHCAWNMLWYIFVNCIWVDTRWQQ